MGRLLLGCLTLCLLLMSSHPAQGAEGPVVLMGGGARSKVVLSSFIKLAGGEDARILVFAQGSADPTTTGAFLANQLRDAGAPSVDLVRGEGRELDRPGTLETISRATAAIFAGGDQSRLMAAFKATQALKALHILHDRGGVIAGTGPGALVLGSTFISGDSLRHRGERFPFNYMEANNVVLEAGMGFVKGVLIDEAFVREGRQSRLLTAVMEGVAPMGLGISDLAAVVITSGGEWEVIGSQTVHIYDIREAKGVGQGADHQLRGSGIILHVLLAGDKYDLKRGRVKQASSPADP